MNADKLPGGLTELTNAWATCQEYAPLQPIRNASDFAQVQQLADRLADEVGDAQDHALSSLFDMAMLLIEDWERDNVHIPSAPGRDVLRHLLDEHDLQEKDLEAIAPAALITDILAGRREISRPLAEALAQRFHVDAAAFL